MSKKANPTLIGGFVLGALVLLVGGLIVFGSGRFFQSTLTYVAFFKGSVKGLQVGAPVSFRGIPVGSVSQITGVYDRETADINVAVLLEFPEDEGSTIEIGKKDAKYSELRGHELMDFLIKKRGLRAKLGLQSPITAQLYVQLEFYPDSPIEPFDVQMHYPQFPTVETGLQKFMRAVEDLPLQKIVEKVKNTLDSVERVASAPEIPEILRNSDAAMRDTRQLAERVNSRIEPLMEQLEGAAAAARDAMLQAERTLAFDQGVPGELAANVNQTSRAATAAFNQARKTLALTEGEPGRIAADVRDTLAKTQTTLDLVNGFLDEGSPFREDLRILMQELGAAARSLRVMADYLERHPEALLKGKPQY